MPQENDIPQEDVIIVGAGPVGCTLAYELALRGIATTVLEQEATNERIEPRALTLHRRTIDQLSMRGILPEFERAFEDLLRSNSVPENGAGHRPRPHFGGIAGFADSHAREDQRGTILIDRQDVERILRTRAIDLGVRIRNSYRVTAAEQHQNRVIVSCDAEGEHRTLEAPYVVGCDGPRSVVRRCAGLGFEETEPTLTTLMGLIRHGTENLPGGWERLDNGWFMRMLDGRIAITEWRHDPTAVGPPSLPEFEAAIERVTGQRTRLSDPVFVSRYSDRTGLATTYRNGRMLIAGDAAHVHFPAGGQGVNLGMQDAFNLGWKLAAAVASAGEYDVLDSYAAERRPIAQAVISNTQAQLAVMRPGAQVSALRELFGSLLEVDGVADVLCGMITGTAVRTVHDDQHPLAGRFLTDVADHLADRKFTENAFESGRHVVFRDDDAGLVANGDLPSHLETCQLSTGARGSMSFVFRPDGYLAWAGRS
jgi:2-polyprenyl-6-methoxyphenol hydroxylase-like FAD-dependent oxidoreductase